MGTAAGTGNLSIALVVLVAVIGAAAGDSIAHLLGQRASGVVGRLLFRGEKGKRRLETVGRQIKQRGGVLLITARFIPGGRTALTFTCGATQQPYRSWFLRWDIVAVVIWATYAAGLALFSVSGSTTPRRSYCACGGAEYDWSHRGRAGHPPPLTPPRSRSGHFCARKWA
ncbi:MAG: VTT domain-containing protein [Acidimicrobiales bacterium]